MCSSREWWWNVAGMVSMITPVVEATSQPESWIQQLDEHSRRSDGQCYFVIFFATCLGHVDDLLDAHGGRQHLMSIVDGNTSGVFAVECYFSLLAIGAVNVEVFVEF